jgi:hypothetical protein
MRKSNVALRPQVSVLEEAWRSTSSSTFNARRQNGTAQALLLQESGFRPETCQFRDISRFIGTRGYSA